MAGLMTPEARPLFPDGDPLAQPRISQERLCWCKERKVQNLLIIQEGVNDFDTIFWTALFMCAYYAAFRVLEFFLGGDEAKWLILNHVILRSDGWICFEIFKTKIIKLDVCNLYYFHSLWVKSLAPCKRLRTI